MRFILLILVGLFSLNVWAVDAKTLSAACMACHGANGVSNSPIWPNLAGQKKEYLVKQLKAFKSGDRTDPLMNPLAANLSDEEIEALAQYFSSMKSQ
jgi:cytochrome c553